MAHRPMKTRDIYREATLPSRNILNTTLVTQVEVIENGVSKYYNFDSRCKVYAMLEDTGKKLRIIINHKNRKDEQIESNVF